MRLVPVVAIAFALVPAALAAPAAHVRLVGTGVVGSGFHARERVVVTLRTGSEHWTKTTVATAAGRFTARFAVSLARGGCEGFSVLAVGARGERATWKSTPKPCANPIGP